MLFRSLSNDIKGKNDIGKFLLSISGTAKDADFLAQLTKLQQLIDERDQIRLQATENAEVSKSINTRIQNQKEIIYKSINNEIATLQNQKQYVTSLMSEADNKFIKIPNQQAEYNRLQRLFNVNEKFYSLLLDKKAEFSIKIGRAHV